MRTMTTKEAFEALISQPMWWYGVLENSKKAAKLKGEYKRKNVSIAHMEKVLTAAGCMVAQEKQWYVSPLIEKAAKNVTNEHAN